MSHGLSYGVRGAGLTIVGLELGLLFVLVVAGAGVGSVLVASEAAFNVVKVLGACYLIYIGWCQWRAGSAGAMGGDLAAAPMSRRRRVFTGMLTNTTNPKSILFMVAVLPQFIAESRPLWQQLVVMGGTLVMVDLIVMNGYAAGASALRQLMQSASAMRAQNRVFGSLLMAVGAGLFFVRRTGTSA